MCSGDLRTVGNINLSANQLTVFNGEFDEVVANDLKISGAFKSFTMSVKKSELNFLILSAPNLPELNIKGITCKNLIFESNETPQQLTTKVHLDDFTVLDKALLSGFQFKRDFIFKNSLVNKLVCIGSDFCEFTDFSGNTYETAPQFYSSKFFPATRFDNCSFNEISSSAEDAYRDIKLKMIASSNSSGELLFTSLELECYWRIKTWKEDFPVKFFGLIYMISNSFGRSIGKPIFHIVWITIICWALFYTQKDSVYIESSTAKSWYAQIASEPPSIKGLWFTLVNASGPLKLHPSAGKFIAGNWIVLIISTLQTLVSTYLWFLIITWIRRRFKTH